MKMDATLYDTILPILKIIWIDILLSGDNAMVIALACRNLPKRQRKWGIALGAGAAVTLRVIFMFIVVWLLALPFLKLAGGLLLFWIAWQLLSEDEDAGHEIDASDSLWRAVRTIAMADAVMSLDNVVAIAAAAKDSFSLVVFGVGLSIPLIVFGSSAFLWLMQRFTIIVWAGAALLGWIAGDLIVSDPKVADWLGAWSGPAHQLGGPVGAALVVAAGLFARWRRPPEI
jgi:YjbE family integral membrane protein